LALPRKWGAAGVVLGKASPKSSAAFARRSRLRTTRASPSASCRIDAARSLSDVAAERLAVLRQANDKADGAIDARRACGQSSRGGSGNERELHKRIIDAVAAVAAARRRGVGAAPAPCAAPHRGSPDRNPAPRPEEVAWRVGRPATSSPASTPDGGRACGSAAELFRCQSRPLDLIRTDLAAVRALAKHADTEGSVPEVRKFDREVVEDQRFEHVIWRVLCMRLAAAVVRQRGNRSESGTPAGIELLAMCPHRTRPDLNSILLPNSRPITEPADQPGAQSTRSTLYKIWQI
jgi:hypothetical protein